MLIYLNTNNGPRGRPVVFTRVKPAADSVFSVLARLRSYSRKAVTSFANPTIAAVCALVLMACTSQSSSTDVSAMMAKQVGQATELMGPNWPSRPEQLPTTGGDIYTANLDSQIRALEFKLATQADATVSSMLAGLYYHRFQLQGRVDDANSALEMLVESLESQSATAAQQLVLARILTGMHEFDEALATIDAASNSGARDADVLEARNAIYAARNLPPGPAPLSRPNDYVSAVQGAAQLLEQGELFLASQMLYQAQELYTDSSPFPLAWIHLQQGIAFLRYEQFEQAKVFFQAAHDRLPQYFLATEHLAETESLLGNWQSAAELYRMVTDQNDQPGFWHGLEQAETELGNIQDAVFAAERAETNYRLLLQQHPLTFADHAVYYYLETGKEGLALELAQMNFANRQDMFARLALAEALISSGDSRGGCEQVQAIREAGLAPPEIELPGLIHSACPPS